MEITYHRNVKIDSDVHMISSKMLSKKVKDFLKERSVLNPFYMMNQSTSRLRIYLNIEISVVDCIDFHIK